MKYETIADIYAANADVRERLGSTLAGVTHEEAAALPAGEKWSVRMIVEHLAMVEFGTMRICSRLLEAAKADGKPGDGGAHISAEFGQKSREIAEMKVEAPERVQPTGTVSIGDSLKKMAENRADLDALRPELEAVDLSGHTFPHPFFGEITAPEWLAMLGGHEMRHLRQIERLLEKVRQ